MKQPATLPTLRRQGAALTVLALAVVLAALAGLCFGSQGYTPLQLWQAWCSGDPQNAVYRVLLHVRWPRTLAGLLAGSALAAAGVLLQAVLNNAMASPNVIGVNAGAGWRHCVLRLCGLPTPTRYSLRRLPGRWPPPCWCTGWRWGPG